MRNRGSESDTVDNEVWGMETPKTAGMADREGRHLIARLSAWITHLQAWLSLASLIIIAWTMMTPTPLTQGKMSDLRFVIVFCVASTQTFYWYSYVIAQMNCD